MRVVIGSIGSTNTADLRSEWNGLFAERGVDAFFDFYRTSARNLDLRLSEMFQLQRRGYIVAPELSQVIVPLLDRCAVDRVDTVTNDGGVLVGEWLEGDREKRWMRWFGTRAA